MSRTRMLIHRRVRANEVPCPCTFNCTNQGSALPPRSHWAGVYLTYIRLSSLKIGILVRVLQVAGQWDSRLHILRESSHFASPIIAATEKETKQKN